jgi:hypothetical protein
MLHYLQVAPETDGDPLGTFFTKPMAAATSLKDSFKSASKEIGQMDVEMTKVVKTMGINTAQSLQLKQNFNESYQEIVSLGGKFSDVTDQQNALLNVSGRNLISLKSQSEQLFAAVSVTGLKAEELQKSFYDAGMEGAHIAENIVKIVEVSNQLGVNAQAVAGTVTTNLDKLNRFGFTNGVEGLAKMAGKAQALRFDVTETFELADDLMSPEKAIETAAAIQRLGGAATALTDPLKLMDLAQNDVGGLQDELGKLAKQYTYMDEKTGTFQIMPGARRQLKEVADALGIDRKEFEKMALETSKLEDKMSKISFPDLDISKEDKEQLANLAQLQIKDGKQEYVVNYTDKDGVLKTEKLSEIGTEQLALIKEQNKAVEGKDPQEQLVNIAKDQLGQFGRLAAANERIANTIPLTIASSKGGEAGLKFAADKNTGIAEAAASAFGPKSNFKTGMDKFGSDAEKIGGLLTTSVTEIITTLTSVSATLFKSTLEFTTTLATQITNLNIDPEELKKKAKDGFYAPNDGVKSINDGFKQPQQIGDSLKTPTGTFDIYEKDYMLIATKLPEVLQKSSETGMKNVLNEKMGDISSIISGALSNINTNSNKENSQSQKQEVVHTVNFKISVDGPKNKLTDMLVEELPKNPTLMQYIVKHFDNTKTSGGMTSKK